MDFNNTSTKDGLIQACEGFLGFEDGDISGNAALLKIFTRHLNDRYNQNTSWIWKATADWQYDDKNKSDLPEASCDLVLNQQDYELPTSAQKLMGVAVKNSDGNYQLLIPIDRSQITVDMSEFYEDAGMPVYYDVIGRSILLYPKPGSGNVTVSSGLKVIVSRDVTLFNSTATKTEPGFAINFHRILPIGASIDYAVGKGMWNTVNSLRLEQKEVKSDMQEFYARRHKDPDDKLKIEPKDESSI